MVARVDRTHSGNGLTSWLLRVTKILRNKIFHHAQGSKIFQKKHSTMLEEAKYSRKNITMLEEANAFFAAGTGCEGVGGVRA